MNYSFTIVSLSLFHLIFSNGHGLELSSQNLDEICECGNDSIEIDLSNKNISSIDEDTFKNYTHLRYLDLSNNQLKSFKLSDGATYLIQLDLSNNMIENLDSLAFNNLNTLILSRNKLKNLGANLFMNLSKLKYLEIRQNKLEQFNLESIRNSESLRSLDLSSNSIGVVRKGDLKNFRSLVINFSDNPIIKVGYLNEKLNDICSNSCKIILN